MFYELPKVIIDEETGMYQVIVGRWRVLQTLFDGGYENIPAELVEWNTEQAAVANLSSNMTASTNWQVDPWDIQLLIDGGREQQEVAELIGCSPAKISQLLSVFSLIEPLQDKVRAGLLQGRDNILKCNRLSAAGQETLAELNGQITSKHINELLAARKVKPFQGVDDGPDYGIAYDWADGQDYSAQGLTISGPALDNLIEGQPVEVEIDGRKFIIQVTEVIDD
jgi:ParB-like chromosome segregation protein Spo0J